MTEEISEVDKIISRIAKAGMPTYEDQISLYELLKSSSLLRCLHKILKESDDKLLLIARSNLGDEKTLKESIKVQGEAIGLSRAVEAIIELATTKEKQDV